MYYDPLVPEACTEDDALEVKEKARANFCDYFKPTGDAYTPGERDAFTVRHLQGFSINEIAEALGLRSNAVKNAIFRAVSKMRHELAPIAGQTR